MQFNIIQNQHVLRADLVKGDKSDKNHLIFISVESFGPNQAQQDILWIACQFPAYCEISLV